MIIQIFWNKNIRNMKNNQAVKLRMLTETQQNQNTKSTLLFYIQFRLSSRATI